MQKEGLPMPPHHPLLGHLLIVGNIMSKLPNDVHGHVLPRQISKTYPNIGPVFYVDTWPFGPPILALTSADAANQATVAHSLPKFAMLREYMKPMTGGIDLTTLEGRQWKTWRTVFNPGFSANYLMTMVPQMLKDVLVFCDILEQRVAGGHIFSLDPLTINLNLDIIGRLALDVVFNAQRERNSFTTALRSQIRWLSFGNEANLFERWHPLRPIMRLWNARRMVSFVSREMDRRFLRNVNHPESSSGARSRTIIDLALDKYLTEQGGNKPGEATMDATFKDAAVCQIRTFLFAGHDTSSSTLCYCYHLLSVHPRICDEVIMEHNQVLGQNLGQAASMIGENPHLLNQLPYTLAVIKETLRLYPPASSTRQGEPGFSIVASDGRQCPTDGFLVWSNHMAIHRNPHSWKQPDDFLPQRWLVGKDDFLFNGDKGAWRSFEYGPRNCIGQELAILELKLILAVTLRKFKVESAYDEYDKTQPRKGPKTVDGDRVYQVLSGAAHPSDGFPCKVSMRT
ncbi:MAG: hypothetical protein Q9225_005738 [Loekoesia sp. 1 TL-2023]